MTFCCIILSAVIWVNWVNDLDLLPPPDSVWNETAPLVLLYNYFLNTMTSHTLPLLFFSCFSEIRWHTVYNNLICLPLLLSQILSRLFFIIFQKGTKLLCLFFFLLLFFCSFSAAGPLLELFFVRLYHFKELFSSPSYDFPRVRVCDTSDWRRQGFPWCLTGDGPLCALISFAGERR